MLTSRSFVLAAACAFAPLTWVACSSDPSAQPTNGADAAADGPSAATDAAVEAASSPDGGADGAASLAPDLGCTAPGCLRVATKIGDYAKSVLVPLVDPRVQLDNGYTVWTIEYVTAGTTSLATVTVPFDGAPPAGGYHVVANNHGTTGLDDPCRYTGKVYGAGMAGLFGARGMIGVASDYPGIGTQGLHPYLVSDVEGKAALDALRAVRQLARWKGIALSERYAMAGLSQGGHVSLAAAALHKAYAPELDVRAFAAAAPASGFEEQWRSGFSVDGSHIPFHAMMVYAWTEHYGFAGPSPWLAGAAAQVKDAMTKRCIADIDGSGAIGDAIGTQRDAIFTPEFIAAYSSGTWGTYADFAKWFANNRIKPFTQTAPVKIWQGDADTLVLESATAELVAALQAGGNTIEYEVVPGATHLDLAFGFVAAYEQRTAASIAWLRGKLDAP